MAKPNTSLPAAPASQRIETYYVQLPDGRVVTRTVEELAELPDELRSELLFVSPETGRV
jgi:hypothetical protein